MEFIDGHPVTHHRVRFRNRIEITEAQADLVKDGNVVCWLLRARCQPPAYGAVARDEVDRYRLSVQDVEVAMPLSDDLRDSALAYLDRGDRDQLYVTREGSLAFPFQDWTSDTIDGDDVARLAAFLDERDQLSGRNPINAAIALLDSLLPAEPSESASVGFASTGYKDPPINTQDVVSPYLNETAGSSDVEVVGSIYRKQPRWMEGEWK